MMLPCHHGLATCCWQKFGLARAPFEGRVGCMSIAAKPEEGRHACRYDVRGVLSTKRVCLAGTFYTSQLTVTSCNPNAVPLEDHFNE